MKVLQDIYWTDMHPNQTQEARMLDIADVCHTAYCWTIDRLIDGTYVITEETMYDVIDKQMKSEWIEMRPAKVCPWTTTRYAIRKACHDWLDEPLFKKQDYIWYAAGLKEHHEKCIYIPYSGMKVTDSVQIERVCRVPIDPVVIPTRVHLVIAHHTPGKWMAEIRAAKKAGQ